MIYLFIPQTAIAPGVLAGLYALIALWRPRRLRAFASHLAPQLFLMKSDSGLFCVSGAEVGPQVLFEMQTCAAMDLCARRRAASRTGRQSSHTELALSKSSVVPNILYFGKLVWLASVGLQFVCQQNSQAELAHRTCAPVASRVAPPKNISANLSGWPQLGPNLFTDITHT